MITKERLEELIKEGATIWSITNGTLKPIKLDGDYFSLEEKYRRNYYFEIKKQAEWALKYRRTRTEELDLPVWEEFCKHNKTICFIAKDWQCYELGFAFGDAETICLDKVVLGVNTNQKTWKATEKNYIKACDLCLKLFEGEENGN